MVVATDKPFDVKALKELDASKVDESQNYEVEFAIGPLQSWRRFNGGRWKEAGPTADGKVNMVMEPQIHTAVFHGSTVIGLISTHNTWVHANKTNEEVYGTVSLTGPAHKFTRQKVQLREGGSLPKGDVNRMLAVLSFKETEKASDEPETFANATQMFQSMVKTITETMLPAAVAAAVDAALKAKK